MGMELQGLSLDEWHIRYRQQGEWSGNIQDYLFNQAQLNYGDKILEVGSGTGAILEILSEKGYQSLTGIDINFASLAYAKQSNVPHQLIHGDGYHLPFPAHTFKVSFCHYFLLWLDDPDHILMEMRRVTKPGGCVIALAEPDHQARIDYPAPLARLGELQTQSLQEQGVDIQIGRKLRSLFHAIGLIDIQSGILGAQWSAEHTGDPTEWSMLEADLESVIDKHSLVEFQQIDQKAWMEGKRVLFVPTFYAMGKVP